MAWTLYQQLMAQQQFMVVAQPSDGIRVQLSYPAIEVLLRLYVPPEDQTSTFEKLCLIHQTLYAEQA